MSRYLSIVSSAVVSIVCMYVAGGCAVQGSEQDPAAGEPLPQDLTTPQLLTFTQAFTTDQFGNIHLSGVLNISDNKEVDMEIIQSPVNVPNMSVVVMMGAFAAANSIVGSFALGTAATIHTFNVIGPQVNVSVIGGPPNTAVNIQGWLFVH